MPNSLKFVDTIANTPATRLDVNNNSPFYLAGFDAPPPRLRRATSSTMLVDGDVVSAAAYEPRTVHMSWKLIGDSDTTAAGIQALGRELDRPTNLLRWLPTNATNPVFFRVRRSDYSSIEERHNINGVRTVDADLLCEPFALGLREDLTAVTISNDPVGTNPMNATLGAVKGDVPTPALIWHMSGAFIGYYELLGMDHAAATTGTPPVYQAESATNGTDTTTTAVAGTSGGSVKRCTFANANLVTRMSGMLLPMTEPGSYRLYARIRNVTAAATTYRFRYGEMVNATPLYGDTVTVALPGNTSWRMVDLGLWQFPAGSPVAEYGYTGAPLPRAGWASQGFLDAARDSGTASVDIDFVMAVPAYGDMSITSCNADLAGFGVTFDGPGDNVVTWTGTAFAALQYSGGMMSRVGGLPQLWPGQVNRLWHVWSLGSDFAGHSITDTVSLGVSYWPRYLYVRPLTT